jgi:NAD(P)-dependent dehydrogenase (short-subunit alcohol dehydrogenase family)
MGSTMPLHCILFIIGHATARLFADNGWNVAVTMRDVSAAGDLARRDNVFVSRLDVTDPACIDETIKTSS